MSFNKYLLTILAYFLPLLVGINYFIKYQHRNKVSNSYFHQKLFEIGYFKEKTDPYKKAKILNLHPTNYFSLPLDNKSIGKINNKVLSLNRNGFRFNPYNKKSNFKKKCILFLGSSAAFGVGSSSDESTIPSILNKKLGSDYSVYNLSIPSWNSRQELISLINFINHKEVEQCSTIDTISFSGTTDLIGIDSLKKSSFYYDKNIRRNLYSAAEYFPQLEENLEIAIKSKNELRYNFKTISNKIINILFGDLIKAFQSRDNKIKIISEFDKDEDIEFVSGQIKSFILNQKTISLLANNLGGNHLLVLQPNLRNNRKEELDWLRKNKILTNLINNQSCINILDLRNHFNEKQAKYKYENKLIPLSLEDSIKLELFKTKDLSKHFFFDNSHLTDLGNKEIAYKIYESYLDKVSINKCLLTNVIKSQ